MVNEKQLEKTVLLRKERPPELEKDDRCLREEAFAEMPRLSVDGCFEERRKRNAAVNARRVLREQRKSSEWKMEEKIKRKITHLSPYVRSVKEGFLEEPSMSMARPLKIDTTSTMASNTRNAPSHSIDLTIHSKDLSLEEDSSISPIGSLSRRTSFFPDMILDDDVFLSSVRGCGIFEECRKQQIWEPAMEDSLVERNQSQFLSPYWNTSEEMWSPLKKELDTSKELKNQLETFVEKEGKDTVERMISVFATHGIEDVVLADVDSSDSDVSTTTYAASIQPNRIVASVSNGTKQDHLRLPSARLLMTLLDAR